MALADAYRNQQRISQGSNLEKISHDPIRPVRLEFFDLGSAGGYRDYFCLDGASASDVQRSIADHQNFFICKFPFQETCAPFARDGRDFIPLLVIIRKSAGFKNVP